MHISGPHDELRAILADAIRERWCILRIDLRDEHSATLRPTY